MPSWYLSSHVAPFMGKHSESNTLSTTAFSPSSLILGSDSSSTSSVFVGLDATSISVATETACHSLSRSSRSRKELKQLKQVQTAPGLPGVEYCQSFHLDCALIQLSWRSYSSLNRKRKDSRVKITMRRFHNSLHLC